MIEELFQVTKDIPKHIDMNSRKFEELFIEATKDSISAETQDHDWRYIRAVFTSYHEAVECEKRLTEMFKSFNPSVV